MLCRQCHGLDTCSLPGGRECGLSDAVVGLYRQCLRSFCTVWRAVDTDKARRNRYHLPWSFRSRQELKRNILEPTSVPPLMGRLSRPSIPVVTSAILARSIPPSVGEVEDFKVGQGDVNAKPGVGSDQLNAMPEGQPTYGLLKKVSNSLLSAIWSGRNPANASRGICKANASYQHCYQKTLPHEHRKIAAIGQRLGQGARGQYLSEMRSNEILSGAASHFRP